MATINDGRLNGVQIVTLNEAPYFTAIVQVRKEPVTASAGKMQEKLSEEGDVKWRHALFWKAKILCQQSWILEIQETANMRAEVAVYKRYCHDCHFLNAVKKNKKK